MTASASRLAKAIRSGASREAERRGPGRCRGTVLRVDPLLVDVQGADDRLDQDDITLGRSVAAAGVNVGDVLILIEVDDDEWVAVQREIADGEEVEEPGPGLFIGQVALSGIGAPSADWLLCDGTAVTEASGKVALRDALIAAGSPWGTSGSDPRVPNLSGRVAVGVKSGEAEWDTLGDTGGARTHTLATTEMPGHTHAPPVGSEFLARLTTGGADLTLGSGAALATRYSSNSATQSVGGGQAHNNEQPFLAINSYIYAGP